MSGPATSLNAILETNSLEVPPTPQPFPALGRIVNPLHEPGWDSLIETHGEGGFFHTTAWARVLHETYGHEPVYFCDIRDEKLRGLLPVMEVRRPWLGLCGVSLPFTDSCTPLFGEPRWNPYELAVQHG